MLREHGAQRPSVFDLLDAVHRMRGTQSKFRYVRNMHNGAFPTLTLIKFGVSAESCLKRAAAIAIRGISRCNLDTAKAQCYLGRGR